MDIYLSTAASAISTIRRSLCATHSTKIIAMERSLMSPKRPVWPAADTEWPSRPAITTTTDCRSVRDAVRAKHSVSEQRRWNVHRRDEKSGVAAPGWASSAVWFDYDNDGRLDLFVGQFCEFNKTLSCGVDKDGTHHYCIPRIFKPRQAGCFITTRRDFHRCEPRDGNRGASRESVGRGRDRY